MTIISTDDTSSPFHGTSETPTVVSTGLAFIYVGGLKNRQNPPNTAQQTSLILQDVTPKKNDFDRTS